VDTHLLHERIEQSPERRCFLVVRLGTNAESIKRENRRWVFYQ
jgi:hypothetical protein